MVVYPVCSVYCACDLVTQFTRSCSCRRDSLRGTERPRAAFCYPRPAWPCARCTAERGSFGSKCFIRHVYTNRRTLSVLQETKHATNINLSITSSSVISEREVRGVTPFYASTIPTGNWSHVSKDNG